MVLPRVVSREEWFTARKHLLAEEKEFTRARDELSAERRRLPMVRVDKEYVFDGPEGKVTLPDLFEGRKQLIVHHLMWLPDRGEVCPSCTFQMNDLGDVTHLHDKDTTLVGVTRGPQVDIDAYRERMGWTFPCYSSLGSDFNYDFHVTLDEDVVPLLINFRTRAEHEQAVGAWDIWGDELPGVSVFLRDEGTVFHTYSTYSRGLDILLFTLNYLDLTPLGRQNP
jgi:predicted dithiol-disulfide oxidoreductase (DUF899 family)